MTSRSHDMALSRRLVVRDQRGYDVEDAAAVTHLDISSTHLGALESFTSLVSITLAGNSLVSLASLVALPPTLVRLDVSGNTGLQTLEGFERLRCAARIEYFGAARCRLGVEAAARPLGPLSVACNMREIDVSSTGLSTLSGIEQLPKLNVLSATDCCISDMCALVELLGSLRLLTELALRGNPVQFDAMYRHLCLRAAEQLVLLDGVRVPPVHAIRARRLWCEEHNNDIEERNRLIALAHGKPRPATSPAPLVPLVVAVCVDRRAGGESNASKTSGKPPLSGAGRSTTPGPPRVRERRRGMLRVQSDSAFIAPNLPCRPRTAPQRASRIPQRYSVRFDERNVPRSRDAKKDRPSTGSGMQRRRRRRLRTGGRSVVPLDAGGSQRHPPTLRVFDSGSAFMNSSTVSSPQRPRGRGRVGGGEVQVLGSQRIHKLSAQQRLAAALPGRSLHSSGAPRHRSARHHLFEALPLNGMVSATARKGRGRPRKR